MAPHARGSCAVAEPGHASAASDWCEVVRKQCEVLKCWGLS